MKRQDIVDKMLANIGSASIHGEGKCTKFDYCNNTYFILDYSTSQNCVNQVVISGMEVDSMRIDTVDLANAAAKAREAWLESLVNSI